MKTIIASISIITLFSFNGVSQVNPHAIGLRGGAGNYGSGGEVSYQHGIGESNRLELDLGWRGRNNGFIGNGNGNGNDYNYLYVAGIYHWNFNITEGLNWFVGPGAIVGFYNDRYDDSYDGISIGLGGQIGIEYDFNDLGAPILLGLDTRPMWSFINGGGAGYGAAFSIRYTF
ncbi:MAG: hypothetical protein ACJA1C_002273 [Crocinitomicaceae bacterium]|jgi:hypothetical protein